jgi:Mg-chelatase subunit ChlD
MNNAIVAGSIGSVAEHQGQSIAESFMSAEVVILVDVSGSMFSPDSRGGQSRYDVACEELAKLQNDMPGKLAVVAFSDSVVFVPYGQPPMLGESTDLAKALTFVKMADGTVRFVVISDGYPDDPQEALSIARGFQSQIDTVFVGPESDERGRKFLEKLAKTGHGQFVLDLNVNQLAEKVEILLLGSRAQ